MGGGGVMRAAAKVAGFGVHKGGGGGFSPVTSVAAASECAAGARRPSRPASAVLSSFAPAPTDEASPTLQWEAEDGWEFAGGEENLSSAASEYPSPRLVFGGVPTFDEAKSATSELKDALEKTNISPPIFSGCHLPLLSDSADVKTCVTWENQDAPIPNHAVQAFKLLKENSKTQAVVASIVSDANVWDAVMQNEALVEFIQSQKRKVSVADMNDAESVADNDGTWSEAETGEIGDKFIGFMQNVKDSFVEMVKRASDFLKSSIGGEERPGDAEPGFAASFMQSPAGASLIALAVTVMMVVVLKRG